MSTSYTLLSTIIGILILFLYFSWLYVSSKHVWNKKEAVIIDSKSKRRWKNLVDKKNEELGWFDLGNHIIIIGVILFAIFIAKNA
jgi:hypothetical protein|tara:strand:- start:3504 stop:3758 length:255 start_codon:yes stop_codon:yes gene_type:complete